ncbi:MAG: thiol:disulfide interchange protein DsbA/DsbL [Rhodanobacteraceae bacterium]|nr:MAG: thiol:disulfide interchange protein DsbA/DsbL [Rhodanobacteraceae bacterium]
MSKHTAVFLLLAAVTGFACAQTAQPHAFVEGKDYFAIPNPQPTNHPGQVVVTEVFSFGCPACNHFEPFIDKLRAELPKGTVMEFIPASWHPNEDWPLFQRTYFTAKALGLDNPKSHDAMFKAVWGPNGVLQTYDPGTQLPKAEKNLPKLADVAKFYAQFGAKPADFIATANSFGVNMDMKRADKQIMAWGVDSTPTLVIDGKWRLTPASTQGAQQAVDAALFLVNKELAAKKAK